MPLKVDQSLFWRLLTWLRGRDGVTGDAAGALRWATAHRSKTSHLLLLVGLHRRLIFLECGLVLRIPEGIWVDAPSSHHVVEKWKRGWRRGLGLYWSRGQGGKACCLHLGLRWWWWLRRGGLLRWQNSREGQRNEYE